MAKETDVERLSRGRYEYEDVTLISPTYQNLRCCWCKVSLAGAPILVIPTDKGYKCADRTICLWRRARTYQKRQLILPFTE